MWKARGWTAPTAALRMAMPHHDRPMANNTDQHAHQAAPGDIQGPYIGHSRSPASREDEIRHLWNELDQA